MQSSRGSLNGGIRAGPCGPRARTSVRVTRETRSHSGRRSLPREAMQSTERE